ncbi:flagellar basal body L-ring protein [Pandoraea communis]|uniref:Flagellar basal body L-ring protein n=1 Tax=Pandoraea communis TaxID=2508297 RepID=A0A5E4YPJ0_9BURK|nr:flagellar basal body L-ring protein FlgH [Pandoraea communis]VVE50407.1 flagellar basal body L-ring protein [Pandoraea communis]
MNGVKGWAGWVIGFALVCNAAMAESLYREETFRPITADNKAFRVDDVLTVQVFENASATSNSDTTTRRSNDIAADVNLTRNPSIAASLGVKGDFDGGGRTQRAGRLLAQITVAVKEVMPNGDLRVAGEQMLTINDEQQKIQLEGRVRPQDVSDGNVVLSTRISDARINYVGYGDLAERGRRAWWRKALDFLGF